MTMVVRLTRTPITEARARLTDLGRGPELLPHGDLVDEADATASEAVSR